MIMKLVKNMKEVWRHYSTGALLAVGGLQLFWKQSPPEWIAAFPLWVTANIAYITMGIAIFGLAGKFIKQDLPSDKAP